MNRHLPSTTNMLPTCAAVFGRVGSSPRNGLPHALQLSSRAVRLQSIRDDEDQVHPGEGAT
jgi:hypothetical protein